MYYGDAFVKGFFILRRKGRGRAGEGIAPPGLKDDYLLSSTRIGASFSSPNTFSPIGEGAKINEKIIL